MIRDLGISGSRRALPAKEGQHKDTTTAPCHLIFACGARERPYPGFIPIHWTVGVSPPGGPGRVALCETIRTIDPADVARHDRMVALVEAMLDLNRRLAAAKTAHEREVLAGMIGATDRQIDRLVYGLSEGEVAIVEEVT